MTSISSASSADIPGCPELEEQPGLANGGEAAPQDTASTKTKSVVWKKWPTALRAVSSLLPMYQSYLENKDPKAKRDWLEKTVSELIEHTFPREMVEQFGVVKVENVRVRPLTFPLLSCEHLLRAVTRQLRRGSTTTGKPRVATPCLKTAAFRPRTRTPKTRMGSRNQRPSLFKRRLTRLGRPALKMWGALGRSSITR